MAVPSISNNTPQEGAITWGAFTIQYLGVSYQIAEGWTTERWVWWRYNAGQAILEAGPDIPANLQDDDLVLFGNKEGIGVRVQSTTLIDGELLIDGSVLAKALAVDSVTADKIKAGEISGDHLNVDTIEAKHIIAGTITSKELGTDVLGGKRVPINKTAELQWGVPNPTGVVSAKITKAPSYLLPPLATDEGGEVVATFRGSDGTWWMLQTKVGDISSGVLSKWKTGDSVREVVRIFTNKELTGYNYNPDGGAGFTNLWADSSHYPSFAVLGDELFVMTDVDYTWDRARGIRVFSISQGYLYTRTLEPGDDVGFASSPVVGGVAYNGVVENVRVGFDYTSNKLVVSRHVRYTDPATNIQESFTQVSKIRETDASLIEFARLDGYIAYGPVYGGTFHLGTYGYLSGWRDEIDVFNSSGALAFHAERPPGQFLSGIVGRGWEGPAYILIGQDEGWMYPQTGGSPTQQTVDFAFTFADTEISGTGYHETKLSPSRTYTIPPRYGISLSMSEGLPKGIDVDQPDCYYVYTRISGGPWTRQKPKGNPEGDYRVFDRYDVVFEPPFTNTGFVAPTESNFSQGKSGTLKSELGGFYVGGDGVGEWPHLEERLLSQTSHPGHDHPEKANTIHTHPLYADKIEVLETEVGRLIANPDPRQVGEVIMFYGTESQCPPGFLIMDGSMFSPTNYPDLLAYLGTATLPDMTGRVARQPTDGQVGKELGGSNSVSMPDHTHSIVGQAGGTSISPTGTTGSTPAPRWAAYDGHNHGGATGVIREANPPISNIPAYMALWHAIKAIAPL